TDETIPLLKVRAVAGAANNQLRAEADAEALRERGILYAPDYVINGAGVMNVAAELESGGYDQKKVLRRVEQIPTVLAEIFERADTHDLSTEAVAEAMANERLT
ncbi:MAG TPA: amino acid dehydrogenase, partial [Pararhizobium sp.]|nr:amino acid dehydrogenase [Pararhizobium sp.]